jgi:uncharacterized surface protein with fasciclin (FAS1) repeats
MRTLRYRPTLVLALSLVIVGSALAGAAAGRDSGDKPRSPSKNIVETAKGAGSFNTLVSLVGQAGLADTLASGGTFTVFAPTDAAFKKVPQETLSALAADPQQLKAVLLYHVAKGELRARKVVKRKSIKTLHGARVKVRVKRRAVKVNNARVVKANVGASNGVIHVIDRVLLPPSGDDD